MQGLTSCLTFTEETGDEFADGWLPTLDMKLKITSENEIQYAFFEKPTCSKICLQSNTALNQNCMIQSLTNEVIRRLKNISESVPWSERIKVLDEFSYKMVNSGHAKPAIWKVLIGGIKGYERDVKKCKETGKPLNRSAAYNARSRKRKKLLAKSNWFRQTDKNEEDVPGGWNQEHKKNQKDVEKQGHGKKAPMPHGWKARGPKKIRQHLRMSTVMFVEYSHDGSLQKRMREVVEKLATMLGFRVRISERGGTPLSSLLSNKNPWGGQSCGRKEGECYPCHQNSEVKEPCTLRNVLYESECGSCNQLGNHSERDKDTLSDTRMPSIYVGESARSLAERSKEHWGDFNKGKTESHMYTHW